MESHNTQPPAVILGILWWAMQLSPVFIGIAMIAMHYADMIKPINPDYAVYLIIASFVAIPAALFFANYFRKTERRLQHEIEFENADAQQKMQQLTALMIIGMAIAEFPTCMSLTVFVMSGELTWAIILLVVSFILGFKFKPDIPR